MLRGAVRLGQIALVIIAVGLTATISASLRLVYKVVLWPFAWTGILDFLYWHSARLRGVFALRLGEAAPEVGARALVGKLGCDFEEHVVETTDGFMLVLHRILPLGSRLLPPRARGGGRPPVLLIHGLMMTSEVWLVGGPRRSLAAALLLAGFDVWLANARGNKYSCRHARLSRADAAYWAYSLDELARLDLPAAVAHVLAATGARRLSLVAFSQGSAQSLAALALSPALQARVSALVALSPAVAVRGLSRSPATAMAEADVNLIYLVFGERAMLPFVVAAQRQLSASAWARILDVCMRYLFSWRGAGTGALMKAAAYQTLFSTTSVRCIVHWFQIISGGRFCQYTEVPRSAWPRALAWMGMAAPAPQGGGGSDEGSGSVPPLYDCSLIGTPIFAFAGGTDTLIDVDATRAALPAESEPVLVTRGDSSSAAFCETLDAACRVPLPLLPPPVEGIGETALLLSARTDVGAEAAVGDDARQLPPPQQPWTPQSSEPSPPPPQGLMFERQRLFLHVEPGMEHLCTLWGDSAPTHIFPAVVLALRRFAAAQFADEADEAEAVAVDELAAADAAAAAAAEHATQSKPAARSPLPRRRDPALSARSRLARTHLSQNGVSPLSAGAASPFFPAVYAAAQPD